MASTKAKVAAAFHEVTANPPAVVAQTRKKKGAAQAHKQQVAIALSKARAAGADVPMMQKSMHGSGPMGAGEMMKGYRDMGKC